MALKLIPPLVALLTEKEVITIFTHPTVLQHFSLAIKTLVSFVLLDLRFKNDLHLVIWLMPLHQTQRLVSVSFEVTLLT